MMAQGHDLVV